MTRPRRSAAQAAAMSAALSGAVDLSALKARAEAAKQPQRPSGAPAGPSAAQSGTSEAVLNVTEATFPVDVVERSMKQLVIVDLWAEWCGPCKQLSPLLERLAAESNGAWVLAKVDVDANPRIAQLFGAQSIPTVVAIAGGQPVDAFSGALPEPEIQKWLAALYAALRDKLPSIQAAEAAAEAERPEDPRFVEAEAATERGDYAAAEASYQKILDTEPNNPLARDALVQVRFLARIDGVDPTIVEKANSEPENIDAQLTAADYELAQGQPEQAFARLVRLVRNTFGDDRNRVREHLVGLFELFEATDERVLQARRDLASALF